MIGRVCAWMALTAVLCAVHVHSASAEPLTAAFCRSHLAASSYRISGKARSLSSVHKTEVNSLCQTVHKSGSVLHFIVRHQWLVAPRYHKWWQVKGNRRRIVVRKFRAIERVHKLKLARATAKLQHYAEEMLYVGNVSAWKCIHSHEGAWNSNTGNGYFGGLQMDRGFMSLYGPEYLAKYGTADNWPIYVQIAVAQRAHDSGRGYTPWPNTARDCGLI